MSDIKKIRVGGVDYNISPDLTSYAKKTDLTGYAKKTEIDSLISEVQTKEYYYNDGSNEVVPVKWPDLSTQPSILPYKFMGQYVYEQLIPVKVGDRIVNCDFVVEYPMILSAGVFGVSSFKNVDIIAAKSEALLLATESELGGYINIKYTDSSQLLPSNGYGYGYEDNNTESPNLIDFGVSPDGTKYIYDPNTEVLSLYKSGEITQNSIPQNIPTKKIILGEGVTSIGDSAFMDCKSLKSINIPEGVTIIKRYAFAYCRSLTAITIPEGVTSIGDSAFNGCGSLTSITSKAITPPSISSVTFYAVNKSTPVYVPAESVDAYKAADNWNYFTNIQAI